MSRSGTPPRAAPGRRIDIYDLLLLALILVYVWLFSGLAIDQHLGMRTHKADLGQIDQAVWNSSRGRFVEMTDNGFVATRMTDHVEPILALISPLFWLWDDVRALLLLQVVCAGGGAWFVYRLAQEQIEKSLSPHARRQIWQMEPVRRLAQPLALALALAYLLTPQLQSALLTEFHAAPLAVSLILWAFWAVETERWRQFGLAALLAASVKEEIALLAAGLGLWAIWRAGILPWLSVRRPVSAGATQADKAPDRSGGSTAGVVVGGVVALAAVGWFAVATFVIVPIHAREVYGVAESGYFQRYGALGDSPLDMITSILLHPRLVWSTAAEPARFNYLLGLLAPFGAMALLAPEVLLLALPVLLANLLSAYPAQFYGEFHYSAPLVPYFAVSAAYGLGRFWRWVAGRTARSSASFQHLPAAGTGAMTLAALLHNSRTALRPLMTLLLVLWLLTWAGRAYRQQGRGPLAARFDPTPITAHHRLLSRFVEQIPRDAAVTATAAVHPHVSHRRFVYQFPIGLTAPARAEWALLDVTTASDMAPGDLKWRVDELLATDWGVVDAADGFLLLHRGGGDKQIPASFYDFARTGAEPTDVADVASAGLQLLSVDVDDWPRWRQTLVVSHWRVGKDFDAGQNRPLLELRTPAGATVYRFADSTPPALLWYPPPLWQAGETLHITTLPLYLPRSWGVTVDATTADAVTPTVIPEADSPLALVAAFVRNRRGRLVRQPADRLFQAEFGAAIADDLRVNVGATQGVFETRDGATLAVQAWLPARASWPGDTIDVWLRWNGPALWPEPLVPFLHLRDRADNLSQNDGRPRYFVRYALPTALARQGSVGDWRQLVLPVDDRDDLELQIYVGLYDPQSGTRAEALDIDGQNVGNELWVGALPLGRPPVPDQACALIPATCASQP